MTPVDTLIIGGGLAGTTLAWSLMHRGQRVAIVDRGTKRSSSIIAAGLMTPITGKRLALSWRWTELRPFAESFYRTIEIATQTAFFHERGMVRLFRNERECAVFANRVDAEFRGLVQQPEPLVNSQEFANALGGFAMPTAAQLDVKTYLDCSRRAFREAGMLHEVDIDLATDIAPSADRVTCHPLNLEARTAIFCLGYHPEPNPWFPSLQFNSAKGEILTLRIPDLRETRILNRGVWLAPLDREMFRAGSTYEREQLDGEPTERGRNEIESRLREFLRLPFEVIDHAAAVRPIIRESRGVLGFHTEHPRIGIFNGLGSKGSLLAPFFAAQLADVLCGTGQIDTDVRA